MNKLSLPSFRLKRHLWPALATFASVIGASFAYLLTASPIYETTARLILDERRVSVSELGRTLSEVPNSVPGGPSPIATQAELVKSQQVLRRSLDQVFGQGSGESLNNAPTVEKLTKDLRVKIIPATNILELSYKNQNPELAKKLLNAITEAMVEEDARSIRLEASSVRKFLETKVPEEQAKLEQAEVAESQYRRASGIISPVPQTESLVNGLATIEEQERTLLAQIREARTRGNLLQRVTGVNALTNAYTAIRLGQDEELKKLRSSLLDAEAAVIDKQSRLGDKHPDLLAAIDQRDATRALYARQLARIIPESRGTNSSGVSDQISADLISKFITGEVERNALESRLQAVQAERSKLRARIAQFPITQQPLAALVRQREEAENSLKLLQGKLEEARIAEAQLVGNVRIIDRAETPSSPAAPKPSMVLVVAVFAGALLAAGVVLLLELLDDTIRDEADVEALLKLPVLGVLPKLPLDLENHLDTFLDNPALVEPYRRLLKTIESRGGKRPGAILINSATAGEGKSNVAACLGAVATMSLNRTLIMDADLRHPLQHKFFNLPSSPGLSEFILGSKGLDEAAHLTSIDKLSVMPHGQLPDRPSALLESPAMANLLKDATASYDLVMVDTSPMSDYADAITLSRYTDGILLVVHPNVTPKGPLVRAVAELRESGASILGVVMNETSDPKDNYSNYIEQSQPPARTLRSPLAQDEPIGISKVKGTSATIQEKVQE
ncbi:polysaccharide biosynthesis tyrosine autokinase [Kovacikia minuta CCNUW1]|uniref:GumC family protein n=1 Tax=Kovacikia minuta TaxID=2931930 RepID=UPI001CC9E9C7|nr:polysaccharide biosynthesis tyrosine autokinase [Kovacikia minuta]UBF27323.1 polysaccharide biosynthesis tyrosine autokinase [Kovacikia minuta CCNUW1]